DRHQAMERIEQLIRQLPASKRSHWEILGPGKIDVSMRGGARRQKVTVALEGTSYVFRSVVLRSAFVTRNVTRWRRLAVMAWERNCGHQVVTFGFDAEDQLVGAVEHPAAFLDAEELWAYVEALAWECDRLEEVVVGGDVE
ncbi:MAG: hypothetical protein KDA27_17365, partial [Candidatus Eisenbacteria bacterium]|nr:hypothetical protein [Candidatus Eisenbacteria bacterium]